MVCRYLTLTMDSFFLKRVLESVSAGEPHVSSGEILFAERWGCDQVDACLGGVLIPSGIDTPSQIEDAARMFASHKLMMMLNVANAPNESDFVKLLFTGARAALKEITSGKKSLVLRDGEVHENYPGPTQGERFAKNDQPEQEKRYHIQPNKPFTEMGHFEAIEEAPESEEFNDPLYTNP